MTERSPLGWYVSARSWARLERHTRDKHGALGVNVRFELEEAMREWLDDDDVLREAERLLRGHTDLRGLSSSTDPTGIGRDRGGRTRKVMNRVNDSLTANFRSHATEAETTAYGRLLSRAIDAYVDGGRAQRILDDVRRLVTGGDTGTSAVENRDAGDQESSTASATGITPSPDAETVIEVAEELPINSIPGTVLRREIAKATDGPIDMDTYCEAVLDEVDAVEHPHVEDVYLTEEFRDEATLWADLNKSERVILLRRYIAADAVERDKSHGAYTYTDVEDIFEYKTMAGPSHQYAYDLMEAAADEDGFSYKKHRGQKQLLVDIENVSDSVREWALQENGIEPGDPPGQPTPTAGKHVATDGGEPPSTESGESGESR